MLLAPRRRLLRSAGGNKTAACNFLGERDFLANPGQRWLKDVNIFSFAFCQFFVVFFLLFPPSNVLANGEGCVCVNIFPHIFSTCFQNHHDPGAFSPRQEQAESQSVFSQPSPTAQPLGSSLRSAPEGMSGQKDSAAPSDPCKFAWAG